MTHLRARLTFDRRLVTEPVIHQLGHRFAIVSNIRRADVSANEGWVVLELTGEEAELERGVAWLKEQGVHVEPVTGDVVEG